jgi:hypothetical protein
LGYDTMRSRSEVCAFRFGDIANAPNCRPIIKLKFSKTDQYGAGKVLHISLDLATLPQQCSEILGRESYILRSINRHRHIGNNLNPTSVSTILKGLQKKLNTDTTQQSLSGHSFRVGAALDLLEQGEDIENIMLREGWQPDPSAMKYLRNWSM